MEDERLVMTLETEYGKYKFYRVPVGRAGILHYSILTKYFPDKISEELTPKERDMIAKGFEEWCDKVLPQIIIESTYDVDKIPGEDMMQIFLAVVTKGQANVEELFRIPK